MKDKKMRYSDVELSKIKGLFAENEPLLLALRKFFLQLPLSEEENTTLDIIRKDDLAMSVMRKAFLPIIDGDAPLGQIIDLWMTVSLQGKDSQQVLNEVVARDLLIKYLDQQLSLLGGSKKGKMMLDEMIDFKDGDTAYQKLVARNTIVNHVEMQLNSFEVLAGQKNETIEETMARLQKDSAK